MKEKIITRRDFLRVTAGTAMATTLGSGILGEARGEQTAKVVLIRNAEVLGPQDKVQEEILQSMLDEAVKSLVGTDKPMEAWKKLFKSSDVVGIKSNGKQEGRCLLFDYLGRGGGSQGLTLDKIIKEQLDA